MKKLTMVKKTKVKAGNTYAYGEKPGVRGLKNNQFSPHLRKERGKIRFMPDFSIIILSVLSVLVFTSPAFPEIRILKGQTLYVPVYSHIYHGNRDKEPVDLAATLSIRNTDFVNAINITSIDYYDSDGALVKKHLDKTLTIKPLGSARVIVKESDKSGGSGAKFIVKWESSVKITEPVIETIMIGTQAQQGISFTSRAQALKETE